MAQTNVTVNSFNRGLLSSLGGARTDLERLPLSASVYNNAVPRILGSTALRVGWGYTGATHSNNTAIHIPFIYSFSDQAILEFTDSVMRVKIDETPITRQTLSTTVADGDMGAATGWTDADESGATSGVSGGYMTLLGTGYNAAIRRQQVTVAAGDQNKEHALRIVVTIGPIYLKVGSSSGGEEYIAELELGTGTHSIAFTPTGDFHIELAGRRQYTAKIDSCTVEDSGIMAFPSPYTVDNLPYLRWDQSADVIYIDCKDVSPRKVIRTLGKNNTRSWSLEVYEPEDGPFLAPHTGRVKLTPSALTGDITLTASRAFFTSGNVGSIFRLTSVGQNVSVTATGAGQWSSEIRVTGTGSQRAFTVTRASLGGTGTTATLQRSVGDTSSWIEVTTYTTDASGTYTDGLDNQIVYYRIGVDTGDYSSGSPVLSLAYSSGGTTGEVRITAYSSATSVSAIVLDNLGATTETEIWSEGAWSTRRGFPTAAALYEGRIFHGGLGKIWGSVSDTFESFDSGVTGDSAPITRTLPGQVEIVSWLLAGRRLLIGTESAEFVLKSSLNDEVITQTNVNVKQVSSRGAKNIPAALVDTTGVYVTRAGDELNELDYSVDVDDFRPDDLSRLVPEFLEEGIIRVAVQRHPDTRIHCILDDGTAAILIFDKVEDVKAWVTVSTDGGIIEDAFVLPGASEDRVYYSVKRTINGSVVRYLEKWALESECQGGTTNKMADSFVSFTGVSTTTITGLDHLEGEEVIVWADGVDLSPHDDDWVQTTYTVASGQITTTTAVNSAIIGLPYKAQWKSTRLAYGAAETALTQYKKVDHLGLIAQNMHKNALRYGADFTDMDPLPLMEDGAEVAANTVHAEYDSESIEFDGIWDTDSRVCLEMYAPRPCTLLALVIGMTTNEKR